MQFKEDPKNLIVPLELTKIIYSEWEAEQAILDRPDQVYGKALHGSGTVKFKNGNEYAGTFHNGMLHGKGKFLWVNGVVYDGEFTYNKIQGIGTYKWPDGSLFNGQVINGLRHGDGKFVAAGDSAIYEGQWQNGLRHGLGTVNFKSGAFYEGYFQSGNKHGQGKMTYPSGNFYEGAFANDKKGGFGTMNWVSSSEKYYGQWQDNMQNGWGTHIWVESKGEGSKFLRNRYEGEWENGERCGAGVFYYANGAKYIGEWHNNLKQGEAIFLTDSGGIILGLFHQDRLSQVYATTENETRTGILPREIAPKSKEDHDLVTDQMAKASSSNQQKSGNQTQQKSEKTTEKKDSKKTTKDVPTSEKLAGINSPQNATANMVNINAKQIEANPYSYMIDISDLFRGLNIDASAVEFNVQTMLLRHNSTLKAWYKFFATKYEAGLSENTFSLNLEGFWKITRDVHDTTNYQAKLLNPQFSLAQLNRIYQNGVKNRFVLNHQQDHLKKQIETLKKYGKKMNLNDLDDIFYVDFSNTVLDKTGADHVDYDKIDPTYEPIKFDCPTPDVHDATTALLFRHFVELLVRVAYLKYGSLVDLHRAIERIIINRITPLYERKKGKGLDQSENESKSIHQKSKINFEDYINDLRPLYNRLAKDKIDSRIGRVDRTVSLEDVFKLLETAGIMQEVDKTFVAAHIERHFDTEEGSLNQPSAVDQSSMQLAASKDDKPKRRKQPKDQDTSHVGEIKEKDGHLKNMNKLEKWVVYLGNELILYEFADIVITVLTRKNKDLLHPKEEEQRSRINVIIKKLIEVPLKHTVKVIQPRAWPRSLKDQQKDDLKNVRAQQDARAKQKKLTEEERKKEERERNMMALEDQDVKSEYEDEGGSEDSDY